MPFHCKDFARGPLRVGISKSKSVQPSPAERRVTFPANFLKKSSNQDTGVRTRSLSLITPLNMNLIIVLFIKSALDQLGLTLFFRSIPNYRFPIFTPERDFPYVFYSYELTNAREELSKPVVFLLLVPFICEEPSTDLLARCFELYAPESSLVRKVRLSPPLVWVSM